MKSIVVSSILSMLKFILLLAFWIIVFSLLTNFKIEELGNITMLEYIQKIADGTITKPIEAFKDMSQENAKIFINSWKLVQTSGIIFLGFGVFLNLGSMILIKITKNSILTVILGLIKLVTGSFISAIVYFAQSGKLKK